MPKQKAAPTKPRPSQREAGSRNASGASRADSGAAAPGSAPPDVDALIEALEKIGVVEQSIKPGVLVGYPDLIASTEVQRRLRHPGNGGRDAGQVAHEALKGAIAYQRDDIDGVIATAVLADHPDFAGKTVDERKAKLITHQPVACSEDQFKKRRPRVVRLMADYLANGRGVEQERAERINSGPLVPKVHEAAISALSCLVGDARRLAEICEMYLAVQALDTALQEIDDETRLRRHRPALITPMWRAYRDLLLSSAYCLHDPTSAAAQQVARYLPHDVLESVKARLAEINSIIGVDASAWRLIFDVYTRGIADHDLSGYRKQFHDVYSGWWWDFAEGEAHHYPAEFAASLTTIADACQAVHRQLRNYVQNAGFDDTAKEQALAAAADYYGADLTLKVLDLGSSRRSDGTLRELLDLARPDPDDEEPFSLIGWQSPEA